FDVDLPLTGAAGIECRAPGPNNSFNLVYSFNKAVSTAGTAGKTQGTGAVGQAAIGQNPNEVKVPLTGVTNAQHFIAHLDGVQDSVGSPTLNGLSARFDVLLGDVNANGLVNSTDASLTQAQSGQAVSLQNFRMDTNGNGLINSTDASLVRGGSGTGLP